MLFIYGSPSVARFFMPIFAQNQCMNTVLIEDWGHIEYGAAWEKQEKHMESALAIKSSRFRNDPSETGPIEAAIPHYLFFCQHPHVYTMGKSGAIEHLLINNSRMKDLNVQFYKTNRGGDITYHGPGQMVAYPMLDLEQYFTDLGKYMRSLEEAVIQTLKVFGIDAGRLEGATGVWIEPERPDKARKICAMGVKSSRWVTMHGLALNINTQLDFFNYIVPCGIVDKGVTSMQKELQAPVDEQAVKEVFIEKFAAVFSSRLIPNSLVTS